MRGLRGAQGLWMEVRFHSACTGNSEEGDSSAWLLLE